VIYLDYNATSPLRPEAFAAMEPYLRQHFGNPSSVHAAGRAARVALDEAREQVAALVGAEPREIVFTAGATEANNLALQGAAARLGGLFVSTAVEHPSVLEPLAALVARGTVRHETLAMDAAGALELDAAPLGAAALVSVMLANNETGRLFPVAQAAALTRGLVHSDLTQAVGRVPVSVRGLGVHLASFSGHKLGGPKGIGALYVKRGTQLERALHGGKQERSRRPGTENVAAAVGFGAAAAAALGDLAAFQARALALRERLWAGLRRLPVTPVLNTPLDHAVPNTLNVSYPGRDGHDLLQRLDMGGLCVSSGAACASGSPEPSPVLRAIGYDDGRVRGAVRFSLGFATTERDVDDALGVVARALS
jgi:cysteine desulfurase